LDVSILGIPAIKAQGYFTYLHVSKMAYQPEPPSGARRRQAQGLRWNDEMRSGVLLKGI